ncbi:MAG: hypothetical protein CO185_00125, partial [Candidatus Zambryskibacteria bacterium CG_4_9_14_3_um_filter_42_15]
MNKNKKTIHVLTLKSAAFTFLVVSLLGVIYLASVGRVYADFNPQINYQGRLVDSDGDAVADGVYHMRFKLYTTLSGGSALWEEDRSTDLGDRVTITNGLFSLMLGSSTPLTASDFNQTLYLSVEIGGSSGSPTWDGEMSPRKIFGAVPSAFVASTLDGLTAEQFLRSDTLNSDALFTRSTTTAATTTNFFATTASTTNLIVGSSLSVFGTSGTAWSDFCVSITGGASL